MKKLNMLMISFIILCVILTGCSKATNTQKSYKNFTQPNKIVFYNKGKKTTINKGSALFNNILEFTDKRFGEKIDFYLMAVEMKDLKQMEKDELMLEFLYSDIVETQYRIDPVISIKYKRLVMPLSGEYTNCMFFDWGSKMSSGPISTLSTPDDLIKILK